MYTTVNFVAQDGGGMLYINDKTVLGGQKTTINKKPVANLAYMARACGMNEDFAIWAKLHAAYCKLGHGRYSGRRGDPSRQSPDNVLAWAWFSVMIPNCSISEDIYNFAKWRFFVYDPHSRYSLDPRCLLPPSYVFALALSASKKPSWFSCIWFTLSAFSASHSADHHLKSMLMSDIVRSKKHLLSKFKRKLVFFGLELLERRCGDLSLWYNQYYRDQPDHPAVISQT